MGKLLTIAKITAGLVANATGVITAVEVASAVEDPNLGMAGAGAIVGTLACSAITGISLYELVFRLEEQPRGPCIEIIGPLASLAGCVIVSLPILPFSFIAGIIAAATSDSAVVGAAWGAGFMSIVFFGMPFAFEQYPIQYQLNDQRNPEQNIAIPIPANPEQNIAIPIPAAKTAIEQELEKLKALNPAIDDNLVAYFDESFICAISLNLMFDPVIIVESGNSYDRKSIEEWLEDKNTDPLTGQRLISKALAPNLNLRGQILQRLQILREQFQAQLIENEEVVIDILPPTRYDSF